MGLCASVYDPAMTGPDIPLLPAPAGRRAWRRARAAAAAAWEGAAAVALPERCLGCGRFGAALHAACAARLPRAAGPRCDRCWAPAPGGAACRDCGAAPGGAAGVPDGGGGPALRATRAPFRFTGEARAAILEAKFRGRTRLLAPLAREAAGVVPAAWGVGLVTAVPSHPVRARRRGFHPAQVAARTVAAELGLPLRPELLRRVGGGPRQARLGRAERALAVRDAFHAPPRDARREPPRPVLLVDDVATTGATLLACAAALAEAGHPAVYALVLARED